jgi:FkbM family methyltransferase
LDTLELKLKDAVTLAVPASLSSMTTFVLLEQETWFEKEMDFLRHWLQPGMTAIDIGANLGIYSLPMARLVGLDGRVFAYEPASETRGLLERSRDLNGARNLEISARALSDGEREGYLVFGTSSELNALGQDGPGESVRITSLDAEDGARHWPAPDLVKIDAEGEEERILAGGRSFFARHSPLIMFEIKTKTKTKTVDDSLCSAFPIMGYRLYRLLAGAPLLVPIDAHETLDGFEINLFSAKPDRASALSQGGFLVDQIPDWEPGEEHLRDALSLLQAQIFAPAFAPLFDGVAPLDLDYRKSLAAYAVWRTPSLPPATRCAALGFAFRNLRALCARAPSAARHATLARISWEWGQRFESVTVLQVLMDNIQRGVLPLAEPFWPPCPRFDTLGPNGQAGVWFAAAVAEQFERCRAYSSCFSASSPVIAWLCTQPFASAEMERRRMLYAVRAGQRPEIPARLRTEAPDHLNADLWRDGKVPDTIAGR